MSLGYCGMNCQECRAYKATVKGDRKALEEVAGRFGEGKFKAEQWVCLGCGEHNTQIHAVFCSQCKIRLCATARGVKVCAVCPDYDGCAQLHDFLRAESEELVRITALLREGFLARKTQATA